MGDTAGRIENDAFTNQLAYSDKELALLNQRLAGGDESARAAPTAAQARPAGAGGERKHSTDSTRQNVATAHPILSAAKAILPKTADTNALLVRWLDVDDTELNEEDLKRREHRRAAAASTNGGWLSGFRDRTRVQLNDPDVIRELMRQRFALRPPRDRHIANLRTRHSRAARLLDLHPPRLLIAIPRILTMPPYYSSATSTGYRRHFNLLRTSSKLDRRPQMDVGRLLIDLPRICENPTTPVMNRTTPVIFNPAQERSHRPF